MRLFIGLAWVCLPLFAVGQADSLNPRILSDSTAVQKVRYLRELNGFYNEVYRLDAELSWVTPPYCDQFAPNQYYLTADISPNFFLIASKRYRYSFIITPRFKVRGLQGESSPVRTPSFMPGGTFNYRLGSKEKRFKYLSASYFHHSNGQDGRELLPNGQFNTRDGNFTTNFLVLAYHWGDWRDGNFTFLTSDSTNLKKKKINQKLRSYQVGVILHVGHDSALTATKAYGFLRTRLRGNWIWLGDYSVWYKKRGESGSRLLDRYQLEKHRLTLQAEYILGTIRSRSLLDIGRRLNVELRYAYRLRSQLSNSFLFAAVGYYGQDPYNIYFEDNYPFARLGLAFGPNVLLTSAAQNRAVR